MQGGANEERRRHHRISRARLLPLDQFGALVTWLMSSRDGLSILVHPLTGDPVAEHTEHALWLGDPLPLDVDCLLRQVDAAIPKNAGI